MKTRKAVLALLLNVAAVLAASLLTTTVRAQELLVHLPLDGKATNLGSAGAADIYTDDGASRPQAVPGKIGQALLFDGPQAIAIPFDLDQTRYPQITVTAWVKEEPGANGSRVIIWSGSSTGPRFELGGSLYSRVGRNAVTYDGGSIPENEWTFIATVVDAKAGSVRLVQNDTMELHDNLDTTIKAPYTFNDPNDPRADAQQYIFVGAPGFRWRSNNRVVALDDIRVYAGALSEAELRNLRDSAGSSALGQLGETEKNSLREGTARLPDALQPGAPASGPDGDNARVAAPAGAAILDPALEAGLEEVRIADINVAGEWVRRESNNNPNDGMRITVSGGKAVLTYVPPTASNNWHEGEIVWQNIGNKGALQVLGSNDAYYDAEIVVETANVVHIDIDANGRGNDQSWVRANPASLPGDQFEQQSLPGDQFEQQSLPGDQFDPQSLPDVTERPGEASSANNLEPGPENQGRRLEAGPTGNTGGNPGLSAPDDLQELAPGMQADGTLANADVPIACEQSEDCPDNQYCALERLCHPNSHLPVDNLRLNEIQASPGYALMPLDEQPDDPPAEAADRGLPRPIGGPVPTGVAGVESKRTITLDLVDTFLSRISVNETNNRPCNISVGGELPNDVSKTESLNGCDDFELEFVFAQSSLFIEVGPALYPNTFPGVGIRGLAVCNNTNRNERVKGVRATGYAVGMDGSSSTSVNGGSSELPNCREWSPLKYCDPLRLGTGLIVHYTLTNRSNGQITGLQLICRRIGFEGDT